MVPRSSFYQTCENKASATQILILEEMRFAEGFYGVSKSKVLSGTSLRLVTMSAGVAVPALHFYFYTEAK